MTAPAGVVVDRHDVSDVVAVKGTNPASTDLEMPARRDRTFVAGTQRRRVDACGRDPVLGFTRAAREVDEFRHGKSRGALAHQCCVRVARGGERLATRLVHTSDELVLTEVHGQDDEQCERVTYLLESEILSILGHP